MDFASDSESSTLELGSLLGRLLSPGDVLGISGELGTGKTVLVRGVARGRGFPGAVTSPTFTIVNVYPQIDLCHIDAFRLDGADEFFDSGIDEYMEGDWVCAVEWAERVSGALPEETLNISIRFTEGECERLVEMSGTGKAVRLIQALERELYSNGSRGT